MHRIDGPGATVDNKFTDGDPVGGVQATLVTDDWLNDVQENIMAVLAAAGVTPVKGRAADLNDAIKQVSSGRLLNIQKFTSSGTYTPTLGMTFCIAKVQGAGGGGGGAIPTGAAGYSAGGGGASGSYAEGKLLASDIGASKAVTIGSGGPGGIGASGSPGGASSIGALVSAPGGLGGEASPQIASGTPLIVYGGVPGAISTGGTLKNSTGIVGGIGFNASGAKGGAGAGSPFHGGGGGPPPSLTTDLVGYAATVPGCGGGGAINGASAAAKTGGAGAPGIIEIWEYA